MKRTRNSNRDTNTNHQNNTETLTQNHTNKWWKTSDSTSQDQSTPSSSSSSFYTWHEHKIPLDIYESSTTYYSNSNFITDFNILAKEYPDFSREYESLKHRQREHHTNALLLQKKGTMGHCVKKERIELMMSMKTTMDSMEHDERPATTPSSSSSGFATFVNHNFNASLTRSLLHCNHGGLKLPSLPSDKLCPPIPNRYNYVLWVRDLVFSSVQSDESTNEKRENIGLDIGVGASCIYPLLCAHTFNLERGWTFYGSDIDLESLNSSQINVNANLAFLNAKQIQIELLHVDSGIGPVQSAFNGIISSKNKKEEKKSVSSIAAGSSTSVERNKSIKLDFCMTNPPFFDSIETINERRSGDSRIRTNMTLNESYYEQGGEVGFIHQMIIDSIQIHQAQQQQTQPKKMICASCRWYTSYIGQKKSLLQILDLLFNKYHFNRGNIRVAQFVQGGSSSSKQHQQSQRRWGIAWTFEVPNIRSLAVKSTQDKCCSSFTVTNCGIMDTKDKYNKKNDDDDMDIDDENIDSDKNKVHIHKSIEEVYERIKEYCTYLQKQQHQQHRDGSNVESSSSSSTHHDSWKLFLYIKPKNKNNTSSATDNDVLVAEQATVTIVEDLSVQSTIPTSSLPVSVTELPKEGHFLVDITLTTTTGCNDSSPGAMSSLHSHSSAVNVDIESYCHTKRGSQIVQRINREIQGDMQRTNRKWRRKLKMIT